MVVEAAGQAVWRALRLSAQRLSPAHLASLGGWLVLAPHQDDETLGAATMIATLAERGRPAWTAFLTDGSGSHRGAPEWPRERVARTRGREAREALRTLGAHPGRVIELSWPDAAPHPAGSTEFKQSCDRLSGLCRREKIRAVAVTWRHEPHTDHHAAYVVARALQARSHGRIAVFEYLVWGWNDPGLKDRVRGFRKLAFENPKGARLGRRAILRHRSQLSPMIAGAETAFRLPPEMAALGGRSPALLLHERYCHAS